LALNSPVAGLVGNAETVALTAFVAWRVSRVAAGLVLPIIP